ncbi:MAG: glucosaminidase domain-containing protein [Thermoleophilia bacterium]|nr:glucosaminidase domain-containing protein [Thermoleophilia bacterium]
MIIWLAAVFVLFLASAVTPDSARAVSADEPIAGFSPVMASQLEAELASVNPGHGFPGLSQMYVEWGYRFGIRADVAFAQMLHETNYLRFTGDVKAHQNNFAGIGATGGGNPGNSFATPELGVIAHYAHLAWYVFPDHVNEFCTPLYDPRHFGDTHRNSVRTIRDLGGQWAVPGTGYGDAIARIATRINSRPPSGYVTGSFNEVPGTPADRLSTSYYFTWYDSLPAHSMLNWILVGNQGIGTARVRITVGSQVIHDPADPSRDYFSIPSGGRITPMIPNMIGGPVKVLSLDGHPLIASQRVLYRDSFNEVLGIRAEDLTDSWEFTWYDSLPQNGMTGNWVLVANMSGQPADVEILIGGRRVALYSAASGNPLTPGQIVTPVFPGTMAGPVLVRSTNHQPLIASQRVLYKDSFTELTGMPTNSLDSQYFFTWYDSVWSSNWVLVANRGSQPADVDILVGGALKARYSSAAGNPIQPGAMVTPVFPNLTDGPVRVISHNNQPLMASQRIIYRNSFEEVQGAPPSLVHPEHLFTWYDSKLINYMRGNWILVANHGSGDARVEIYIGGQKMNDPSNPSNSYFTIPEGGRITPQFYNVMGGPVRVVSVTGQPLMTSQRVLYKDGLSR